MANNEMSEDWEAEFRRLTAELAEEAPLQMETPQHLEGQKLCVALILAPMDNPELLEALLRLTRIEAQVVKLNPWAAAWMEVAGESSEEEETAAFLTGSRPVPEPVDKVARVISRISRHGAVVLVSWLFEDMGLEPGVSGMITGKRYVGGEPEDDLDAGLLLNDLDQKSEDLLLGRKRPEDFPPESKKRGWFGRRRGEPRE